MQQREMAGRKLEEWQEWYGATTPELAIHPPPPDALSAEAMRNPCPRRIATVLAALLLPNARCATSAYDAVQPQGISRTTARIT